MRRIDEVNGVLDCTVDKHDSKERKLPFISDDKRTGNRIYKLPIETTRYFTF